MVDAEAGQKLGHCIVCRRGLAFGHMDRTFTCYHRAITTQQHNSGAVIESMNLPPPPLHIP